MQSSEPDVCPRPKTASAPVGGWRPKLFGNRPADTAEISSPKKGFNAMRKFAKSVVKFVKAEDGPTAVEYAVMLALIIVALLPP